MKAIFLSIFAVALVFAQAPDNAVTVSGAVRNKATGAPLPAAAVSASNASGKWKATINTNASGKYSITLPDANDTYEVRAESRGYTAASERIERPGPGSRYLDFAIYSEDVLGFPGWFEVRVSLLLILLYLIFFLTTRWYKIARPSQEFIRGQIMTVRSRLANESRDDPDVQKRVRDLDDRLGQVESAFVQIGSAPFLRFLFWAQGAENAAWVAVHEIERELSAYLGPPELVKANLLVAQAQLHSVKRDSAGAVAVAIASTLTRWDDNMPGFEWPRRLLAQATAILYDDRDSSFITLMEWQNKATWLIFTSLLFIAFIDIAGGHGILLLIGAAGGLLSRLARTLQRDDMPIDYGASWTTLFMSPLMGALAAWFGIGIVMLLSRPQLQLLGAAFNIVDWSEPLKVTTASVAFALGFSERFFNSVMDVMQDQAAKRSSSAPTAASGASAMSVGTTPPVSVSITPPAAQLQANQLKVFTATVKNAADQGVTWKVTPSETPARIAGNTLSYTAPSPVPLDLKIILEATSVKDKTRSATAEITFTT